MDSLVNDLHVSRAQPAHRAHRARRAPGAPRRLALLALALTAACSLLVAGSQPAVAQDVGDLVDQVLESNYQHYLDDLLYTHDGDNRGIYGPEHDLARDNIFDHFESLGLDTSLHEFNYRSSPYYNVVGVHEGVTTPDQIYIVGAHYDSVSNPGADDNGSGVAGVMEIARICSEQRFDSTVIFIAFDVEEAGLIGSDAWAGDHENEDIRGMISMDMIAYNPDNHNRASIIGRSASDPIKNALADALRDYTTITPSVEGPMDASDHAPFEWRGFEACLLIEYDLWSNPHYHQQSDSVDTPNYIDYAYATEMTKGALGFLAEEAGYLGSVDYMLADPWPGVAGRSNEFRAAGGTAGEMSFFIYGFDAGDTAVPGCPGVVVDMERPTIFHRERADARGEVVFDRFVPRQARGRVIRLQAAEPFSCEVTNLVEFVFD